jgi:predicted dinucleotide-binding enzyme
VQRHLPGARVVKAFNNIDFRRLLVLARPSDAPDRSALPVAGDSTEAKAEAKKLLDALGYDAVDIGTLSEDEGRRWFYENPGIPVHVGQVKELVDAAERR